MAILNLTNFTITSIQHTGSLTDTSTHDFMYATAKDGSGNMVNLMIPLIRDVALITSQASYKSIAKGDAADDTINIPLAPLTAPTDWDSFDPDLLPTAESYTKSGADNAIDAALSSAKGYADAGKTWAMLTSIAKSTDNADVISIPVISDSSDPSSSRRDVATLSKAGVESAIKNALDELGDYYTKTEIDSKIGSDASTQTLIQRIGALEAWIKAHPGTGTTDADSGYLILDGKSIMSATMIEKLFDEYNKYNAETYATKSEVSLKADKKDVDKLSEKVDDIDDISERLDREIENRIAAEKQITAKVAQWIENHNVGYSSSSSSSSSSSYVTNGDIRTRIVYRDTSGNEVIKIINGDVVKLLQESTAKTIVTYMEDLTTMTDEVDGVVLIMSRYVSNGTDSYLELENLPYITYEDKNGNTVKALLKGDVSGLIKLLMPNVTYEKLPDKPKVKYYNKAGEETIKEIPALDDVLDLTDIGIGERVSLIKYVAIGGDRDGETIDDTLRGNVTEYVFDDETKKTTLKFIDPDGDERTIVYDGDVIEVKYGYAGNGTANYRELYHLPEITYFDVDTGTEVHKRLLGDVTDDITDLIKRVGGSSLYYVDSDGERVTLDGDVTDLLASAISMDELAAMGIDIGD